MLKPCAIFLIYIDFKDIHILWDYPQPDGDWEIDQ